MFLPAHLGLSSGGRHRKRGQAWLTGMCQTKGAIGELCSKSWCCWAQEEEKEASVARTGPRGGKRNPPESLMTVSATFGGIAEHRF